jgi:Tfp pilus assembly protein PilF
MAVAVWTGAGRTAIAILGLVMVCTVPAYAGSSTATFTFLRNCQNRELDADTRIAACSTLIHANLVGHRILGVFYTIRAGAYGDKPDFALAMQDYDKAIELIPDLPEAHANRANLFERLGKPGDAASDYEQAGMIRERQGDCAKAVDEFSAALRDDATRTLSLYARGVCKSHNGDNPAGQADMTAALAADPDIVHKYDSAK